MKPVRVVIAEDNDGLRALLPLLINEVPSLQCVGTTGHLHELAPLIARDQAQVVILDIELRGGSSLKLLPSLRQEFPATRFIIHSGHSHPELLRLSGADACVRKSGDIEELVAAIQSVAPVN